FPDASIIYLTKEKYRSVVEMIDGVDEILSIDDSISTIAYFKFLNEIDSQCDLIFDLHGNFRSWMAQKILTANHKVTYPKRRIERRMIVKNKSLPDIYPHTIDLYNQTLLELDKIAYHHRPVIKTKRRNDEHLSQFFSQNKQVIVFYPGASYSTKQYSPEKFAIAAVELYKQTGSAIVWADANVSDEVPQLLNEISESSFLRLSNSPIQELASVIENSELTVANDSGIAHLSSAVNTPVLALFGPTHPVLGFAPRGMFDQVIHVQEECRPCSLHGGKTCYRDSRFCFDKIEPERIVNLAIHKLEQSKMTEKAVFLDRDGTIIKDKDYLSNPDEIEIIDGSIEALKNLQDAGYKLVVVSNQS
ncbi:MAG: HAD-IIIA family hydrolase, partial [Candidatus Heimdallarchaeota archaeon]|nr:HAD-IIIA family hydrolase [Candidatus Heimdallarchaeota archaeon]